MYPSGRIAIVSLLTWALVAGNSEAGLVKDFINKITASNNQTDNSVKESSPICGSSVFSTQDERTISPEVIFITDRPARSEFVHEQASNLHNQHDNRDSNQRGRQVNEVANEFRFHVENVTLQELEQNGFNRDAPVSFIMHGFTSGYPMQAWISSIVEAYTIDRDSKGSSHGGNHAGGQEGVRGSRQRFSSNGSGLKHNLFVINWHYAARGILYPRAVANIPIVASYMTRFINDKIIGEAGVDPKRIELIGHSLGAHLAGFIGKNTRSKLGKIYGLDPAGPCFGAISGKLYPSNRRLAPGDAHEVITIHTNSALLGIDKPLGRYSIFVEGGAIQPGCRDGGILTSLGSISTEGAEKVVCSHSRAPNLFTYRLGQPSEAEECQMVAYECKNWDSFKEGQCGICESGSERARSSSESYTGSGFPRSVQCKRIGLEWQYGEGRPTSSSYDNYGYSDSPNGARRTTRRPNFEESYENYDRSTTRRPSSSNYDNDNDYNNNENNRFTSTTRRARYLSSTSSSYDDARHDGPTTRRPRNSTSSYESYENQAGDYNYGSNGSGSTSRYRDRYSTTIRPAYGYDRNRREANNARNTTSGIEKARGPKNNKNLEESSTTVNPADSPDSLDESSQSRRANDESVEAKSMFIRTADTQPYCAFHYQVVLELNEPFSGKKPPMSLILQDSQTEASVRRNNNEQNSLTYDEIGYRYNDKVYTHLLTSSTRLKKVDHATLLFRNGLPGGNRILKSLHINYMSNIDPTVRQRFSTRLCLVRKQQEGQGPSGENRFYFEPCDSNQSDHQSSHNNNHNPNSQDENNYTNEHNGARQPTRRPGNNNEKYNSNYD